jgi:hypothetical protein
MTARASLHSDIAQRLLYATILKINEALFPPVTQLELVHTERCNLACSYCFERDALGSRSMETDVTKRAIDLLFDDSGQEAILGITHFGGEPIMNFRGIQTATEHAERRAAETGKAIRFDLTTNGVLLNEPILDYLANHKIRVLGLRTRPFTEVDLASPSISHRGRTFFHHTRNGFAVFRLPTRGALFCPLGRPQSEPASDPFPSSLATSV